MAEEIRDTRERIRSLVEQVLASVPTGHEPDEELPERVVVNSLKSKVGREYDRDESAKSLITEADLRGLADGSRLRIAADAMLTPLARDLISERAIVLVKKPNRDRSLAVTSVAIGADHGGFEYKEKLKMSLAKLGVKARDFGTNSREAVDYPDFAHEVARSVSEGRFEAGIIIDGAGIGSAMTANKVPGVLAAACYSPVLARNAREHNGANVLTLGSSINSFDETAEIVEAFLTAVLTEDRHRRRVSKIGVIQKQYSK